MMYEMEGVIEGSSVTFNGVRSLLKHWKHEIKVAAMFKILYSQGACLRNKRLVDISKLL